jgi:tetratricopeptide (TPR) repeat protein
MTLVLSFCVALLGAPADTESSLDPAALQRRAEALYAEGEYEDAAHAYALAFDASGLPELLYGWAQVERLAGHCEAAVEHYEEFLVRGGDEAPADTSEQFRAVWPQMRANAQAQIDTCRAEVSEPAPAAKPAPAPAPEPATASIVDSAPEPPSRPPPWFRDPWGWSLTGVGAALAVTGGALWGVAVDRDRRADAEPTHEDFRDAVGRAATLQRVGFGLLAGGAAVIVGGAIRFVVVQRRHRRTRVDSGVVVRGPGLQWRF